MIDLDHLQDRPVDVLLDEAARAPVLAMPPKALLNGTDVRTIFESILPDALIEDLVTASRFQERERKLDAMRLVRAMIIAAGTGYGGRQADVMRLYFKSGAPRVARGGFYAWFGAALEQVVKAVADHARSMLQREESDLPPLMAQYARDWHIVDSSTVELPKSLFDEYPGTGEYAALKVHKRYSVGVGAVWDYHLSPAREHDAPHLTIDESWRGLGLLVDLGYASLQLISDCAHFEVTFVMRLKENWKPRVEHIARGEVTRTFVPGTDLDLLLESETLKLDGKVIDLDVTIGPPSRSVSCRLVGVPVPGKGYRFYLTNLPPAVGPLQIADIYRVRWEIESDNKLDKSCHHLDEIGARTAAAARALVHASLTSSMLCGVLAHRHRLKEGLASRKNAIRQTPPLHQQALGRAMGSGAEMIAAALELTGQEAARQWEHIASYLQHLAEDPNWRRSPSILDQLRGWKITPYARTKRLASTGKRLN